MQTCLTKFCKKTPKIKTDRNQNLNIFNQAAGKLCTVLVAVQAYTMHSKSFQTSKIYSEKNVIVQLNTNKTLQLTTQRKVDSIAPEQDTLLLKTADLSVSPKVKHSEGGII